jgi:hypothetical protein
MRNALAAAALLALFASSAEAQVWRGNDTGGIIPWSPLAELDRRLIASDHCARYFKYAKITSVVRGYGNFIGFQCRFPDRYGRPIIITRY